MTHHLKEKSRNSFKYCTVLCYSLLNKLLLKNVNNILCC